MKKNYCGLMKDCGLGADENHKELCSHFWSSNGKHEHCSLRSGDGKCGSGRAFQNRLDQLLDKSLGVR